MRTGRSGDLQADAMNHGGPEKALHRYPRDHYATWFSETPDFGPTFAEAAAFGEYAPTLGPSATSSPTLAAAAELQRLRLNYNS
jgi:hypothetical protein